MLQQPRAHTLSVCVCTRLNMAAASPPSLNSLQNVAPNDVTTTECRYCWFVLGPLQDQTWTSASSASVCRSDGLLTDLFNKFSYREDFFSKRSLMSLQFFAGCLYHRDETMISFCIFYECEMRSKCERRAQMSADTSVRTHINTACRRQRSVY